ncbi:hypothetical protein A7982_12007 [Minicystis rosea]|nr:hypothetical protein A7982_12007 [Minicystis rosea]
MLPSSTGSGGFSSWRSILDRFDEEAAGLAGAGPTDSRSEHLPGPVVRMMPAPTAAPDPASDRASRLQWSAQSLHSEARDRTTSTDR